MQLEWMENHRDLVEKFIKYGNAYAKSYEKKFEYGTDIKFTAAQIQTLEYVLENENQNMSEIAKRLGISKSTFSRHVNKLVDMNLLEKYKSTSNQKDIYIYISDYGKKIYEEYSKYVYDIWFKEMFKIINEIPKDHIDTFKYILDKFADAFIQIREGKVEKAKLELIKIKK